MKKGSFKVLLICSTIALGVFSSSFCNAKDILLKVGAQGEEVKQVQTKLKQLGYFNEEVTGYYGEITKTAVERFQTDRKFTADGIVGSATWGALIGKETVSTSSSQTAAAKPAPKFAGVLKVGITSDSVKAVQSKLKELGFFNEEVTGYYGEVTKKSVISFQSKNGLDADGIVGQGTWNKLFGTSGQTEKPKETVSRGSVPRDQALVDWSDAKNIFKVGTTATVIDIDTGITFKVKRSFGTNHADCETVSAEDTAQMKKAFGGTWNWDRRAIIVVVGNRKIAASMSGYPHAGVDSEPALSIVSKRSGGYGKGQNLDSVKGNGMDGHFDIHFLNSKTHGTNKVDPGHQAAVKKAADYISEN